jgi:GNAT superfamily N-acetyltransferase
VAVEEPRAPRPRPPPLCSGVNTTHRAYADEAGDFVRLARFITDQDAHLRLHSAWCLGRFCDWRYGLWGVKATTPGFWEANARLWFDGFGDVAGLAISEDGGPEFAILTTAGHRFLFEEILDWVLEAWGGREGTPSIELGVQAGPEVLPLERRGFRHTSSCTSYTFDLRAEPGPPFPLEPGFEIVDMHTRPDRRAQRILRANGFQWRSDLTEEEIEQQLRLDERGRQSPIYHPDTDLCVRAPDGRYVAGCEALIDARNAAADIERVCTHSAFRRRGFARAVIGACLGRLHAMGLRRAYIAGYSAAAVALYGSLGADTRREEPIYRREAGA